MKIAYKHLKNNIKSSNSMEDISSKLFQLGHEHEINDEIFDIELTPNRGDCLSLNGILRDLNIFYDIEIANELFLEDIDLLKFDFDNKIQDFCPKISFMKIDIEDVVEDYDGELKSFFEDLSNNRNNFFTDISNYISYETGQPTHCYDYQKIDGKLTLEQINEDTEFNTLLGKKVDLSGKNNVFTIDNNIINLAGIVGGKDSSCSDSTKSVLIECAFFKPEDIIGKSVKYDIQSDAAHKFERGVDHKNQENTLRRFAYIVSKHTKIKDIKFVTHEFNKIQSTQINFNPEKINKILGIEEEKSKLAEYLKKINITIKDKIAHIPSYRNDLETTNDLAEEIARIIGYNNIASKEILIATQPNKDILDKENIIRTYLIKNGFFEVINQPFVSESHKNSIKIDNPLDSNKNFLRTSLKSSLIENLLFNERRQQESIKLFEISDIYYSDASVQKKKKLAIIGSGRIANNYKFFQKKISNDYFEDLFKQIIPGIETLLIDIPRNNLDTKSKSRIMYLELDLDKINVDHLKLMEANKIPQKFFKVEKISDFPSSVRDISFLVKDIEKMKELEETMLSFEIKILKDVFVFDYFKNEKAKEIKIGFRFIFQDKDKTLTDKEIEKIFIMIIKKAYSIESVSVPGYNL